MEALAPEGAIEQAHAAEDAGEYARALEIYSRTISDHPDHPELRYFRGRCLFQLGRYSEAIADLTETLRLQPVFLSAYQFRSLARYVTGDHQGAIDDNTQALKFDNLEPEILTRMFYARAMSYKALGEEHLAEQDFEASKYHDPEGKFRPR